MLKRLEFKEVGPAPQMRIDFAPRLNLITGDNGLGKSFLLDTAWWALTRTWARRLVVPHLPPAKPSITFAYSKKTGGEHEYTSVFERMTDTWTVKQARPAIPGLVLYAQVDGGFAVWDPARNYWKKETPNRPHAYLFKPEEVWEGNVLCEGLVRDWASWQREGGDAFVALTHVLGALSPSDSSPLNPGELRKLTLDDPKQYPTLRMPYDQDVAVVHASAGMRRILAVAYLLVWTWREHVASCQLLGFPPTNEIILLFDEIEAHLHPQWQRRIVPALLQVMDVLTGDHNASVQLIAATHSPLVLASVEPVFDEERDKLFLLEERAHKVTLHEQPWAKQGDVLNWLVSDTFGLQQARSIEAERAIEAAEALMRAAGELPPDLDTKKKIHAELVRVLAGHDPFWPRWVVWVEAQELSA
ncbi:MAG: hypothetical protein AUK47_06700 [Deltaproteobacteria bacterium CG2_30_63_29]|nr:MAG: hypothetical protein AUK47_06700 [Deltaproteobacteria bacterium CG2_30_63_29]PJB45063.1 MAG: hypothetical protein CO108_07915 [Deltaproteobacteria bacterium CG_4_9_14_3_um_filter_63_12]